LAWEVRGGIQCGEEHFLEFISNEDALYIYQKDRALSIYHKYRRKPLSK
jgi:hypothetical protein